MSNDLISRNELKEDLIKFFPTDCLDGIESKTLFTQILTDIDNAPTVKQQKVVTIPHELIEKLVLCVVDTVENIDWDKAIEAYKERPQGEWLHPYKTNIACECSVCNMQMPITDYFNFCPNCGAKMKGGEK